MISWENIDGVTPMSCYDYKRMAEALEAMQSEMMAKMGPSSGGICAFWKSTCPWTVGASSLLWLYLELYIWAIEPEAG